jgi:hypothetical protein
MLTWPWADEREGEKEMRVQRDDRLLLKRRRGRQGRGGDPGCGAAWKSNGVERGGWAGFDDVDRQGMDAEAPSRSDSGGRRTPCGHGCDRGGGVRERRGRGRLTSGAGRRRGPVAVAGCGRESERASRAARRGTLAGGPRPQCRVAALADKRAQAAQCRVVRIQTRFKNISNGFKILQTLTDPKSVFPCSKIWK